MPTRDLSFAQNGLCAMITMVCDTLATIVCLTLAFVPWLPVVCDTLVTTFCPNWPWSHDLVVHDVCNQPLAVLAFVP